MLQSFRIAMLALFAVLLARASAADEEIGKGTLHVHPQVMQAYEQFRRTGNPSYFAVSTNGLAGGGSYCPDQACMTSDDKWLAVKACNGYQAQLAEALREKGVTLKGECFLFANASRVLWDGQVIALSKEEYFAWLKTSGFVVKN